MNGFCAIQYGKIANMGRVRVVGRLDIKNENLIKGIHLEGLRVIGQPNNFAKKYYKQGIDELIYIDIVASLYGRSKLTELVSKAVSEIFVPLTVGGGIASINDVDDLLRAGADKVAINTGAVRNPELITAISEKYGRQCMVLSIEAKRKQSGLGWEVYIESGREKTGLDVIEWLREGISRGAGEVLITSIDNDGTRKGFDIELIRAVSSNSSVPVIASGGCGARDHVLNLLDEVDVDAVAIASSLHYDIFCVSNLKKYLKENGCDVR